MLLTNAHIHITSGQPPMIRDTGVSVVAVLKLLQPIPQNWL